MIISKSDYFSKHELQCSHCDLAEMDHRFMLRLDELRATLNKPVYLNSAYRCPEHNDNVSNTGRTGPHTSGKAVDIAAYGTMAWNILHIAVTLQFKGIGVSQKGSYKSRFIHLDDIDSYGRPWVWSY